MTAGMLIDQMISFDSPGFSTSAPKSKSSDLVFDSGAGGVVENDPLTAPAGLESVASKSVRTGLVAVLYFTVIPGAAVTVLVRARPKSEPRV